MNVLDTERPLAKHFFDWCSGEIPGYAAGALDYEAAGFRFRVGPRSFFQVNRFLVDALAETVLGGVSGDHALDLYAGVGLFSLPLANRFSRVVAVEGAYSGAADLRVNAERAGVAVEVVKADSAAYLAGLQERPDFVLADPPREGLGKSAVRELIRIGAPRLTVVACDPATLARDLQTLLGDGGYRLRQLTMVDLFPQTFHIETVAELDRD